MKVMSININKKHLISLSFIISHLSFSVALSLSFIISHLSFSVALLSFSVALTSCQDKDYQREAMVLQAPDAAQVSGQLSGDDYVISWPAQDTEMQVSVYRNGNLSASEVVSGTSYTHRNVPTNVPFEYVLKRFKRMAGAEGKASDYYSQGIVLKFTREGATSIDGITMAQVDKAGGYDILVTWDKAADATSVLFTATNGKRNISEQLAGNATAYTISDVETGDTWEIALQARNDKGTSLPAKSSLLVGKTAIGFLSVYATPDELVANGDDDEASAWLWLHETYPTAQFVPFTSITSAGVIEPYRVLFWLHPGAFTKDHSTHPIYRGLEVETTPDTKLIAFKGPGWTEDHNCLFFNLPSLITGLGNQDEACYTQITQTYGIYPLGTWDSQIWWVSQLNVWEARQGNTDFKGTLLCIGNGGCEFSMKNADGTPDKSAHPKNNIYQDNVLRLAKNALEYLKTK